MNQASHGAGHFGGMGRDHEVRGACNRQEAGSMPEIPVSDDGRENPRGRWACSARRG